MATTNPDNIWTPDSGDDYALTTDLAATADTIQDALTRRANYYVGDSTDMAAQEANAPEGAMFYNTDDSTEYRMESGSWSSLGESPTVKYFRWADATERAAETGMVEGDRGYQEDTGFDYYYDGSNWLVNLPGLNLVTPSSVVGSGASVSGRGVVVLSNVTGEVGIEGVFTSRFRNYRVLIDITTSANVLAQLRLRQGSTNATGSNYDRQAIRGLGTTPSAVQDTGASAWNIPVVTGAGSRHVSTLDLFSPNQPAPTYGVGHAFSSPNPMSTGAGAGALGYLHRNADAYDGLGIVAPSSGSISGTIQVYGYND